MNSTSTTTSLSLPLSEIVSRCKQLRDDARTKDQEFAYLDVGLRDPRVAGRDGGPDMVAALAALAKEGVTAKLDGRTLMIEITVG